MTRQTHRRNENLSSRDREVSRSVRETRPLRNDTKKSGKLVRHEEQNGRRKIYNIEKNKKRGASEVERKRKRARERENKASQEKVLSFIKLISDGFLAYTFMTEILI